MGKFMLEEQNREVRFGGTGENEVLLVRTKNFKSGTKNFQRWNQKFQRQKIIS